MCVPNLSQQQPLWLQLQLNLVPLVVQELLQLQVLQGTQGAVISPVHGNLHLPRLSTQHIIGNVSETQLQYNYIVITL